MKEDELSHTSHKAIICLAITDTGAPAIPPSLLQIKVLNPLESELLVVVGQLQERIAVLIPRQGQMDPLFAMNRPDVYLEFLPVRTVAHESARLGEVAGDATLKVEQIHEFVLVDGAFGDLEPKHHCEVDALVIDARGHHGEADSLVFVELQVGDDLLLQHAIILGHRLLITSQGYELRFLDWLRHSQLLLSRIDFFVPRYEVFLLLHFYWISLLPSDFSVGI